MVLIGGQILTYNPLATNFLYGSKWRFITARGPHSSPTPNPTRRGHFLEDRRFRNSSIWKSLWGGWWSLATPHIWCVWVQSWFGRSSLTASPSLYCSWYRLDRNIQQHEQSVSLHPDKYLKHINRESATECVSARWLAPSRAERIPTLSPPAWGW